MNSLCHQFENWVKNWKTRTLVALVMSAQIFLTPVFSQGEKSRPENRLLENVRTPPNWTQARGLMGHDLMVLGQKQGAYRPVISIDVLGPVPERDWPNFKKNILNRARPTDSKRDSLRFAALESIANEKNHLSFGWIQALTQDNAAETRSTTTVYVRCPDATIHLKGIGHDSEKSQILDAIKIMIASIRC